MNFQDDDFNFFENEGVEEVEIERYTVSSIKGTNARNSYAYHHLLGFCVEADGLPRAGAKKQRRTNNGLTISSRLPLIPQAP